MKPFVGRERELAEFDAALASACGGRGELMLVVGPPGIGKTRLAEVFLERARSAGATAVFGRAWERGGAPPYWPWTEALRPLIGMAGCGVPERVLGSGTIFLEAVLPELAVGTERRPPAETDAAEARFRLFDACTALLGKAAENAPLVIVLDDLHVADAPSLLLLRFVAERLPAFRGVLVALGRDTFVDPAGLWGELNSRLSRIGRRLDLGGLGLADSGALIRARTEEPARHDVVERIHEATGGNPLFVDEITRLLVSSGALASGRLPAPLPLPAAVRDAIRCRYAPLSARCREVLGYAAIVGREFEVGVLAEVAGIEPGEVVDLLDEATAIGLLVAGPRPGSYRFAHILVCETLYDEVAPAERLRRHRRLGEILERRYAADLGPQLPALAHHFLQSAALGAEAGIHYARRAAEQALARLAHEDALRLCEVALRLHDAGCHDEGERARLLLALGEAQRRSGMGPAARPTFLAAAESGRRLRVPEIVARAALGLGHADNDTGRVDTVLVALLEEALSTLPADDRPLRAHLLGRLAEALYFSDRTGRGMQLASEAVAMARRLGRRDVLATSLVRQRFAVWGPDTLDERLRMVEEAIGLAVASGMHEVELVARTWRVADLLERDAIAAADREIAAVVELSERLGLAHHRWRGKALLSARAIMRGEFDRAHRLIEEIVALGRDGGDPMAAQCVAVQRAAVALETGSEERLAEVAEPLREVAERYPAMPVWRSAYARVAAARGRREIARSELAALGADRFRRIPRDGNWLPAMMNASETAVLLGETGALRPLYRTLRPFADRQVVVGAAYACFGSVQRYLGRLAAALGRVRAADRHLQSAAEADAANGAVPFALHSAFERGVLLLRHGPPAKWEEARALTEGAVSAARSLGLPGLVARGERTRRAPASGMGRAAERWTFRREGHFWILATGGTAAVRLPPPMRGLGYIHVLLQHPHRAIPAVELVGGRRLSETVALTDAAVDARGRHEYRERLAELRAALEEARAQCDVGRAERLEAELARLTEWVATTVGMAGRPRLVGSPVERARTAVTKAIRKALARIVAASPPMGHYLMRSIRTGTLCSYEPDPTRPVTWEF